MWSYDLIVEETCIYQNCGWCLTNETDLTFTNSINISVWSIQLFILRIITLRRTLISIMVMTCEAPKTLAFKQDENKICAMLSDMHSNVKYLFSSCFLAFVAFLLIFLFM